MKPFTKLERLLERAVRRQVFGTKMRSFISRGHAGGITAVLDQQFGYARQILDAGLVPILEPEIDITSTEKVQAEELLKRGIAERLPSVPDGRQVMLKLSSPTNDDFYVELIEHSKVLRIVALSGGYSRHQAIKRLARFRRLCNMVRSIGWWVGRHPAGDVPRSADEMRPASVVRWRKSTMTSSWSSV
jgi:fructose-bisphosphate aldolase, class I